jgi:disease resistance protein RPM1
MKPLNLEDSEKLFLSRAFGSIDATCPNELKEVMDNILKKCGGLPLAIISIASVLARYTSSESIVKWETICRSIGSQMESNPTLEGMRQIVTLSYNNLPHELKLCMLYLSIFPEDYAIGKERLLRRWIAEGLVQEQRGLTTLEVAESYLEELLSRNMVEASHFNYNKMEHSYKVHDILLEVMVSKSLESNFVSLLGGQYEEMSYSIIRHLSIHGTGQGRDSRHGVEKVNPRHVRSLTLFKCKLEGRMLLNHLGKFTLLRVLDLEDCEGVTNKHVRYACQLRLLKFLSLRGTNVSKVPPQIGKLEHLQTFDARETCLDGLPETITSLSRLERLQFSNRTMWSGSSGIMWSLPRGLSKMKALQEVGVARLGNNAKVAQEMGELERLQLLSLYVGPDSGGPDGEVLQQLALSLSKKSCSLRWLIIGDTSDGKALNFLHRIPSPPRLLEFLKIDGAIDGLPSWVGSLSYLNCINVSFTALVDDQLFGVLCNLSNLKIIWVERKSYNGHALVARTRHNFPALRDLEVTADDELPKVFRFEQGSMVKLEKLNVNFADKEKSIHGIEHLTNLKVVHLMGKKDNPALKCALDQLKADSKRRPESNQFQVVATYY